MTTEIYEPRDGCPDCAHDCYCGLEYGYCPGHNCYTCGETTYGVQSDKGMNSERDYSPQATAASNEEGDTMPETGAADTQLYGGRGMTKFDELIQAIADEEPIYPGAYINGVSHVLKAAKFQPGRGRHIKTGFTYCGLTADGPSECLIFLQRAAWIKCESCNSFSWSPQLRRV